MKKITILLISYWMACFNTLTAQNMKELFINMPDTLSLILTKVNRADCADFLASKMQAKVTNRFNNSSEVKILNDNYLLAQVTPNSTWEMRKLPLEDSLSVICMVKTVKGPIEDSRILFYSTDWKKLPTEDFLKEMPTSDDFFLSPVPEQADSLNDIRIKANITFIKAKLSATQNTLTFIYNTPEYMNKEDSIKIKQFMKNSPLIYEWKDKRFQPVTNKQQ